MTTASSVTSTPFLVPRSVTRRQEEEVNQKQKEDAKTVIKVVGIAACLYGGYRIFGSIYSWFTAPKIVASTALTSAEVAKISAGTEPTYLKPMIKATTDHWFPWDITIPHGPIFPPPPDTYDALVSGISGSI